MESRDDERTGLIAIGDALQRVVDRLEAQHGLQAAPREDTKGARCWPPFDRRREIERCRR